MEQIEVLELAIMGVIKMQEDLEKIRGYDAEEKVKELDLKILALLQLMSQEENIEALKGVIV